MKEFFKIGSETKDIEKIFEAIDAIDVSLLKILFKKEGSHSQRSRADKDWKWFKKVMI